VYDALVAATVIACRTERLRVGHLVLCDSMRHPAVLAKEAVSIDHASGGRFDLGIGWGSVPEELVSFGVSTAKATGRIGRLTESLEVITRLWSGDVVDFEGDHFRLTGAQQRPVPLTQIPLVIGGSGDRTLDLVGRYADWWNLPVIDLPRLDELRTRVGSARVSAQTFVTLVPEDGRREEVVAAARRRFGAMLDGREVVGTASELIDQLGDLRERGVERLYAWFTDFAPLETIERFGDEVIRPLR
jgi:alkanesulfonate monooxygenase SsuD/methylene tetrahydromethanopterin reductase-like flavin-dependent oxidoreductase (luciferase family)